MQKESGAAKWSAPDVPRRCYGNKGVNSMKDQNKSNLVAAARKSAKSTIETGNVAAGVGEAIAEIKAESVSGVTELLGGVFEQLKAMREDSDRRDKAAAEREAALLARLTAPKVRTVKVAADGSQVVSSGKRGKPPTAGLDDCRDSDGKVRKVGVRAYENETSGIRVSTYRLASRGTHAAGMGVVTSKQAACPYDKRQLAVIEAASEFLDFGLRFKLVKVTESTVKLHPARHLTEIEAANQPVVASLLSSVGLDIDAWTILRTTEDGTAEGEINSTPADVEADGFDD